MKLKEAYQQCIQYNSTVVGSYKSTVACIEFTGDAWATIVTSLSSFRTIDRSVNFSIYFGGTSSDIFNKCKANLMEYLYK